MRPKLYLTALRTDFGLPAGELHRLLCLYMNHAPKGALPVGSDRAQEGGERGAGTYLRWWKSWNSGDGRKGRW